MKTEKKQTVCRICESKLNDFIYLGKTPFADSFPKEKDKYEKQYQLDIKLCAACQCLQMGHQLTMREVFNDDYAFFTNASPAAVEHFEQYAEDIKQLPQSKGFVFEIASNDGTLLEMMKDHSSKVLGIDACANVVRYANDKGIPTLHGFFNQTRGEEIGETEGYADMVIANNVLAHVENINSFVAGVSIILKSTGVFVFEFQYLPQLINNLTWDNFYHEHRMFLSLTAISRLLRKHSMAIVDVVETPQHGGSVRVTASKDMGHLSATATKLINRYEKPLHGLTDFKYRVINNCEKLKLMVEQLQFEGKVVAGYGATAKSCTLLNAADIQLEYIVDLTPHKIGRFAPGTKIPIISPKQEKARYGRADVYLLTAWNYADRILQKERSYMGRGGRFIIPIPNPILI